jgi:hypothetical protein
MSEKKGGKRPDPFALLTEALHGKRRGFKRVCVPELLAWLHMHGTRLVRSVEAARGANRGNHTPSENAYIHSCMLAAGVIQGLIDQAVCGWSNIDWYESCAEVDRQISATEPPDPTNPDRIVLIRLPGKGA